MLWADFRQFLPENSWKGEDLVWEELFTECKWLITRGQQYLCTEPGWFRVMFTSQEWCGEEQISAPFEALKQRLIIWKQKRDTIDFAAASFQLEEGSPVQKMTQNFGHFGMDEDDDLEELESSPELIKAYSAIEA